MELNEYTFQSLFGKHQTKDGVEFEINEIEIPIIQRDYAQGRTTDKVCRVRNRFLDTIYDALSKKMHLSLDFVYGEIINNKLIPLDGQQRLTTLFLLHWYLAKKENVSEKDCDFLNHFTYYTRSSSRDFCKSLVEYFPDFENTISDNLKDQSWFQYQWHNDPTICSMLVMIDAIDEKFKNISNIWDTLVKEQCVSFYFLPISEMGLTDELYIKMNSRGKPLTEFEHFKAEFEGMVAQYDENLSKEINHRFDIEWTDMLFPYRGENKIIDDEFMRYYFFVSDILCYQKGFPIEKDEFKLAKMLYDEDNPDARTNIEFLKKSFDCWCGFDINAFFETYFSEEKYEPGKVCIYQENVNLFKQCCDDYGEYVDGRRRRFPLNMTLLLYGIIVYLQNKKNISELDFQRRIRIIRNLIWNSRDEIRADAQRNNMPQLLIETKEIIITGIIPKGTGYNKMQKEEEQSKIEWLMKYPQKHNSLFQLEDNKLLYGCISVVGLENQSHFKRFEGLFSNCDDWNLVSRALLTIGDYSQRISWRWQLGTPNDSTWSDLFHPSNQRDDFNDTKDVLNKLLSKSTDFNNVVLDEIIDNYLKSNPPKDWRYYFVKYYEDMLSDRYGFYYSYDDLGYRTLRMHTAERLSGRNWNVFILTLYNELIEKYPELELGDFAYQGNMLILSDSLSLDCKEDRFVLYENDEEKKEYPIEQDENSIDIEDRIVKGKKIIKRLIS